MRRLIALAAILAPIAVSAQEAATPAASPLIGMMPMVLIFLVFYVLFLRPQQKRLKEHGAMLGGLKKGDEVITAGGIVGKVVEADKDGITTVEIAPGVSVKITKQSISTLTGKSAAAAETIKKKNSAVKNDNVVLKKDQIANDN